MFHKAIKTTLYLFCRVEQLRQLGHSVDKVEFIVMGGTFMALDEAYRDYFIRNLHDALSGHTSSDVEEAVRYQSYLFKTKFVNCNICRILVSILGKFHV